MAKQTINIGTAPNDGTGDPLRTAFTKTNQNFDELYTQKADLDSPSLTGTPTAPTAAPGTNSTLLSTTAFVAAAIAVLNAAIGLSLNDKANLLSPALTGTPTAPTASLGTTTDQIATTGFVAASISALVGAAPGTLDTLAELAAALADDANFATTVTNSLAAKAPLVSPALTGNPTAPTQSPGDNSTKLATTAYTDAAAAAVSGYPIAGSIPYNGLDVPTGYLPEDGATYSSATYSVLFAKLVKSATITVTIATPGVVSWTGHGLKVGFPVKFTTTGALPTGITAGTTYWIISAGFGTNSFRISATPGGSAINTTGSQSGVHTGICAPHGCANDLTTFNVPDMRGIFPRGFDNGRGIDILRGYGQEQLDAMQGHKHSASVNSGNFLTASGATPGVGNSGNLGTDIFASIVVGNPTADGTNGPPRTDAETRPRNNTKHFCIRYI